MRQKDRFVYVDLAVVNQVINIIGDHTRARRVFQELGHTSAVHTIDAAEQAQYAARLIGDGVQRADVQLCLIQRYGLSRSVAYRRIQWALGIRRATRVMSEVACHG